MCTCGSGKLHIGNFPGFVWQGLGSGGGGYRGGSCEKLLEPSLYPAKPKPTGSMRDPALAKAEPIRDGRSTGAPLGFKAVKEVITWGQLQPKKRGVRICERISSVGTQVSKGEGGGAPGRFPCSPWRAPPWGSWIPEGDCRKPMWREQPAQE